MLSRSSLDAISPHPMVRIAIQFGGQTSNLAEIGWEPLRWANARRTLDARVPHRLCDVWGSGVGSRRRRHAFRGVLRDLAAAAGAGARRPRPVAPLETASSLILLIRNDTKAQGGQFGRTDRRRDRHR